MKATKLIALFSSCLFTATVEANPTGGAIAAGNATINQSGNTTTINQNSDRAIINWQSFNIGGHETTNFVQPTGGVTLNRINPTQGASQIYGRLNANGQIILINPAGIYFGATSVVNVGGLIATTKALSDENFLKGYYHFTPVDGYNGAVINEGQIIAANHGLIALAGDAVRNDGTIQATMGQVVLASANEFTMSFNDNQLVSFVVNSPTTKRAVDQNGNTISDGVKNTGMLSVNGGKLIVTAAAASQVLDKAINMQGVVETRFVGGEAGEVIFSAEPIVDKSGHVYINASIDASGLLANQSGGNVTITGDHIVLGSDTNINVNGNLGGGNILVGGNAYGRGSLHRATINEVQQGAILQANATQLGNGGNIVVWSDGLTQFQGSANATGGLNGGDGGTIETSGHVLNVADAAINLSAPRGQTGNWLLDPADLTICASCGTTASATSLGYAAGSTNSNLDVADLIAALGSANVLVLTTVNGTGGNGDIFVNTAINWSSGNKLTLSAYRNITSTASITNTGGASVVLQADNSGTGTGTVSFSGGNNVALSGGSGTVSVFYNPVVFGTPDTIYTGGTTSTDYMLIHTLGSETDSSGTTNTRSLATVSNSDTYWDKNFALSKDIDASATASWNGGLGLVTIGNTVTDYSGQFSGQGHRLANLSIQRPASSNVGLFGVADSSAVIRDLQVSGIISGLSNVGMIAGQNAGTITNVATQGQVIGLGNNIGGIVGDNSGSVNDVMNIASVTTTGNNAGGIAGNNSGTIDNALSNGIIASTTNEGGLVGNNTGTLTDSFWDTDSSGLTSATGANSGTVTGVTGGCFGGTCTNGGTANLTLAATYSGAGWDMLNTWGIIPNQSYAYLRSIYPTTPWAISGVLASVDPFTGTPYTNSNQTIGLAAAGSVLDYTQTGANGFYYFLGAGNALVDTNPFLLFVSGSSTKANTLSVAPPSGGSITGLSMTPNSVIVASNGVATPLWGFYPSNLPITADLVAPYMSAYYDLVYGAPSYNNFITTDYLAYALGGLSSSDFLYNTNGIDIAVKNGYNFQSTVGTNLGLFGNLTTTNGSIVLNGLLQIGPLQTGNIVNLQTITSGSIQLNHYTFWNMLQGNQFNLFSAENIMINRPILGDLYVADLSPVGLGVQILPVLLEPFLNNVMIPGNVGSTLKISAAYTPNSILPNADITVTNLQIIQGQWKQTVTLSDPNLVYISLIAGGLGAPLFPALNTFLNFEIGDLSIDGSGNIVSSTQAQFLRTAGGTGTTLDPYIILDMYGFQGIGSDAHTLSSSYQLMNHIIGFGAKWFYVGDIGEGFAPIGNAITPFSGTINGLGVADPTGFIYGPPDPIQNPIVAVNMQLDSVWVGANNVGIIGVNTGTISNISFIYSNFAGNNNVGLVGNNQGTITNVTGQSIIALGNQNVGTIAGTNSGTIQYVTVLGAAAKGNTNVGGIAGNNSGLIDQAFYSGLVSGSPAGGIAGINSGTISKSFWNTNSTGQQYVAGSNTGTLTQNSGGCWGGSCLNGGTVDLTSKAPYLAAGWDFDNVWGIDPDSNNGFVIDPNSKSYPYLQSSAPNGYRSVHGITSPGVAFQPILGIVVVPTGNIASPLTAYSSGWTITGADGSFDFAIQTRGFASIGSSTGLGVLGGGVPLSDALTGTVGGATLFGGEAQGTVITLFNPDSRSINNLPVLTSPRAGGTPFNGVLTTPVITALIAGLDINTRVTFQQFRQLYTQTATDVSDFINTAQSFRNVLPALQLGIYGSYGEFLTTASPEEFYYSVDGNMNDMLKQLQQFDKQTNSKYEVIPDKTCL